MMRINVCGYPRPWKQALYVHSLERHLHAVNIFQVWVNQYNVLYNNVPFGGKKLSGIG